LDGGPSRLLQRTRLEGYGYSADPDPQGSARKIYAQCVRLATFAGSGIPRGACDSMPIFAPGSDVEEATQHDFDVIYATPRVQQLTAMTAAEKLSSGLPRSWVDRVVYGDVCPQPRPVDADGNRLECDEYPYYSSDEGGPDSDGAILSDQLRLIDKTQNGLEGTMLYGFYNVCGLTTPAPGSPERKYLVIPMPKQEVLPTTAYCRAGQR
jgi:hypothetical protein